MAILAFQAARLVWAVATPMPTVENASPASPNELAALTRVDPFAAAGPTSMASLSGPSDEGLSLYGVRWSRDGGTAIIGTQGARQSVYRIGDAVMPGLVLTAIGTNHVELRQGAVARRLPLIVAASSQDPAARAASLPPPPSRVASASQPAQASATAAQIDPKDFIAEAGLRPRTQNGRVTGYTLLPRSGGETLRRAGLSAGDVLVALNGNHLTPETYPELAEQLSGASQVQLTVERGSVTKTITLQTSKQ